ncbi:hypothetical protein [Nocardia sp. NPDC057455]|uniref:hypothetical protein n=1 Tax=Nocardia sp. NPDC057455 TaxID=3346138 RepID=UPI00366BD760
MVHLTGGWNRWRATRLTDNAAKGSYRTAVERNALFGIRITRDDSATCLLDTATEEEAIRDVAN